MGDKSSSSFWSFKIQAASWSLFSLLFLVLSSINDSPCSSSFFFLVPGLYFLLIVLFLLTFISLFPHLFYCLPLSSLLSNSPSILLPFRSPFPSLHLLFFPISLFFLKPFLLSPSLLIVMPLIALPSLSHCPFLQPNIFTPFLTTSYPTYSTSILPSLLPFLALLPS